jgi:pimeloyl-ACP methyl ester carboxylesterase
MTAAAYDTFDVAVDGGSLRVGRWQGQPGAPVVVAVHGITGSHMQWPEVVAALDGDVTLVAPDLRGRGASGGLPGPYGMSVHARDLVRVLDHLDVDRAVVVGHSMGGYVATVTGMRSPERVDGIVLVDGGIAVEPPPDVDVDAVMAAVLGPAVARLEMTFATREAYHAFWREHPALGPCWSPAVEAYLDYDLEGTEPELRSRVSIDAVRADSADTLLVEDARVGISKISCPAVLLRAERGMVNQVPPLITDELLAVVQPSAPNLVAVRVVPDTNHYSIALAPHGAAAVADAIREAVG